MGLADGALIARRDLAAVVGRGSRYGGVRRMLRADVERAPEELVGGVGSSRYSSTYFKGNREIF